MSDSTFPDEDAMQAAEYALHLLSPEQRAAFESRLAVSGALRAELATWEEAFAGLSGEFSEVAPPPGLRSRLDKLLFTAPRKARRRFSLRGFLAGSIGGGILAAASLVALLVMMPQQEAPYDGPLFAAEIAAEDRSLLVNASFNPSNNNLLIERQEGAPLPGRSLELWLISDEAEAPISLGLLPAAEDGVIAVPADLAGLMPQGLLAISDEPAGGSPTGAPTGAVLAAGPIAEI